MLNHTFLLVARGSLAGGQISLLSEGQHMAVSASDGNAKVTLFEDGSARAGWRKEPSFGKIVVGGSSLSIHNGYAVVGRERPGVWANIDGLLGYNGSTSFWQCPGGSIAWGERSVCWEGQHIELELSPWKDFSINAAQRVPETSAQVEAAPSAAMVYQRAANGSVGAGPPANATSSSISADPQSSGTETCSAGLVPELTYNGAPGLSFGMLPLAQLLMLI